jgi:polysaccharide deacetylase
MRIHGAGKGIRGSLRRLWILPVRYGLTPDRMRSRVRLMCDELGRAEIPPTIHVTASNIERHPEIVRDLRTADVGLHGNRHIRYTEMSPWEQAQDLDASLATFRSHDLEPHGFRAPYLQTNGDTIALLEARGLSYDSSVPVMTPLPNEAMAERIAAVSASRYGGQRRFQSYRHPGTHVAELPVAIPDDEILVDALRLTTAVLSRIFLTMVRSAARTGTLLVLQVHPERFSICSEAVRAALLAATDMGGWKTSLSEAAAFVLGSPAERTGWLRGSPFAVAVTGDLDALALPDFSLRLMGG